MTGLGFIPFLGKHYALPEPGILMLGINPGGTGYKERDIELAKWNWLLDGPNEKKIRYWSNSRRLFGAHDELKEVMERATYSFCCPYRTPSWNGLPRTRMRSLIRNSRPVLTRMLEDCRPRLIIVAGLAGLDALRTIAAPALELGTTIDRGGDGKGTYQWRLLSARHGERSLIVAQIPHLSRASSHRRLGECSEWLLGVLRRIGAA